MQYFLRMSVGHRYSLKEAELAIWLLIRIWHEFFRLIGSCKYDLFTASITIEASKSSKKS